MKRCTACRSPHVRRSGTHPGEGPSHPFQSPYRCLDCGHRFWVISRRARLGAMAGGLLAAVVVAAVVLPVRHLFSVLPAVTNVSGVASPLEADRPRAADEILRDQSDVLTRALDPGQRAP